MSKREIMQGLLAGEQFDATPQWLMGFENVQLVERLLPVELLYDGYCQYPPGDAYPFTPMGEERLLKEIQFNKYIDRCAFPVGWGANASFGHGGPGEFNNKVINRQKDVFIAQYETGALKEIRIHPHNVHIYDLPVKGKSDLIKLELPDPGDPKRYAGFKEDTAWAKQHGEWTVGWCNGFFSGIHYFLRDYVEILVDLMLDQEFTAAISEKIGNWTLTAVQKMCECGVDCIGFCDDLGSGTSLLMNPELYRKVFWPWHRKLCDLAHSFGVAVHMHSHGAILPILSDIAEAGIDIINPLDPDENMSMDQVREALGPKVVLCGGLNKHFFNWTKDQQVEHLRHVVNTGRRYGPHILMDSGGIPGNVTREWFEWFLEISCDIRRAK
jgi:hypothetical protein